MLTWFERCCWCTHPWSLELFLAHCLQDRFEAQHFGDIGEAASVLPGLVGTVNGSLVPLLPSPPVGPLQQSHERGQAHRCFSGCVVLAECLGCCTDSLSILRHRDETGAREEERGRRLTKPAPGRGTQRACVQTVCVWPAPGRGAQLRVRADRVCMSGARKRDERRGTQGQGQGRPVQWPLRTCVSQYAGTTRSHTLARLHTISPSDQDNTRIYSSVL